MKREFDLNNLTDDEALYIENYLAKRRILKAYSGAAPLFVDIGYRTCDIQMGNPDGHILITQAMSAGFRPHEINAIVAPNYGNADRSVFAEFRQSGKSSTMSELFKPYLEFKLEDQIEESHEQFDCVFNQFRRSKYLPRIELKIGNKYEIQLGENIKHLYLSRIEGDVNYMPELYFSVHKQPKSGTNISVFKILREIK